jgi:MFS family permease
VATGRNARTGWLVAALIFVGWGFLSRRDGRPAPQDAQSESLGAFAGDGGEADTKATDVPLGWTALWRHARGTPKLLGWLLCTALCSLMDEPLVALCALWMKRRFSDDSAVTLAVLALMLGGLSGLVALHRAADRVAPARILLLACAGSALALVLWLGAASLPTAIAATFVLGACSATHYPLAQAAAYRCAPSSSGSVAALAQFFGPVDLLIPLALGVIADRYGLAWALLGLLIQPLALALGLWNQRASRR